MAIALEATAFFLFFADKGAQDMSSVQLMALSARLLEYLQILRAAVLTV